MIYFNGMESKITKGPTELLFEATVLGKYNVKYFRCQETGFIQTEEPFWLEEAYSTAITKLDIGLPFRNELLRDRVSKILIENFDYRKQFLDYAGGYGLFTRLMRDKGFDFYHTDKYCKNLFAEYFDLSDFKEYTSFELITVFEVFEHMANPFEEISELLKLSNNILFTTELQPQKPLLNINDWWYFVPEIGQHISFFTEEALSQIAKRYDYNFYTDGTSLHLFTKKTFEKNPLIPSKDSFFIRKAKKLICGYEKKKYPLPESRLQSDWEFIKKRLA